MAKVREEIRVTSWMIVLIGIWLVWAPFFVWYTDVSKAFWSSLLTGAALVVAALIEITVPRSLRIISWINLLIGAWLILSPYLLRFSEILLPTLLHVGMGILVGAIALGSLIILRTES